ncbi:Beta-lactamase [Roseivivax sp. THAF40]|uniref:serine hydrolase domain-containing protein n=1 Tax=unclassified Roseivivax TaxID=2639302 RepID=UPI0012692689|nr:MULTISPECIES: serine hydrolase [unclassified Roseivivax]QFS83387.1 Beta-lactamase [Roseivivax sp. THAF197b]QFT47131.1 Beta-lactamase [Roseivivax sp. THAF40]
MTNHPIQLTRRATLRGLAGAACLAAPARLWAQDAGAPSDFATRAAGLDQLHALVISKGGERVFAEAFRGPALSAPANIKSVSKTLLALLTGRAIAEGALDGTDARVLPLLGRAPAGDARDALTIGHLLSMRTGLDSTSGGDYGAWIASSDWVDYVLTRDLVAEPGGRFIYSTGGWHVLGAVLARATGRDLHDLAQDWIGDPLDLAMPIWVRDPQGRYLGGNEMAVSAAGLARIGEAVLSQDSAIVPQNWIETSWQRRARSPFSGDGYGYGWFLTEIDGTPVRYGRGYGGQILAVAPEREVVISITSDPTRPARSGGYFGDLKTLMSDILQQV